MAKLYIVRHAWAGEHGDPRYPDDRLRPLTAEGSKRFATLLRRLPDGLVKPSIIATSPLVRCRQTADLLAESLGKKVEVVERNELVPGSDLSELIAWSGTQPVESLAWVGHAPDVGRLTASLVGHAAASIHFAKGAICRIDFAGAPSVGRGELQWLLTAKVLGV